MDEYLADEEIKAILIQWFGPGATFRDEDGAEAIRAIATAAFDKAYAAGQSERNALHAEVEVLRRALEVLSAQWVWLCADDCPVLKEGECNAENAAQCGGAVCKWAISEARKGGEG